MRNRAILPSHGAIEEGSGCTDSHYEPAATRGIGVVEVIVQVFGAEDPVACRFKLDSRAEDRPGPPGK
jgi:hypothetical protein